jgi:glycosyltransferase involved in cell wall biosynthesis
MKRWLILSHAFNMDGRASSLTVTDKIPYLLANGIQLIVLSGVTGRKDPRFIHYQLLPWGPSGLRFDFRHWVATRYGRGFIYKFLTSLTSLLLLPFVVIERFIFGLSSQSSWSLPAALKGALLVKRGEVNVIYSSGGAWSAHYAAWLIKKITGVTWIAEIHDPMIVRVDQSDDGIKRKKRGEARFLQKLEGLICKDADHVWWFTDGAMSYAERRHPVLGDKGFMVIPGAEPPGCHSSLPLKHCYQEHLNICHFGSLANDRSIAPLLEALKLLFKNFPEAKNEIKIQIYGAELDSTSKEAVERLGLRSNVIANGRISRDIILKLMRASDVLLVLHGNHEVCSEYIPSKLYDYYWTNRPIFAITNRNSQLDEMLVKKNAYLSHTADITSTVNTIQLIWEDWKQGNLREMPFEPVSPEGAVRQILDRIRKT